MKVLAFGHEKGVGKDESAKFAMQYLRFTGRYKNIIKCGFADKMKDICHQLYSWADLKDRHYYDQYREEREKILPRIGKTPRQLWIDVGMGMREIFEDTWVHFLLNAIRADFVVISDLRFPNEAEAIKAVGGKVIKIDRPSVPHVSDPADDPLLYYTGWSDRIINDGTLGDLNQKVTAIIQDMIN